MVVYPPESRMIMRKVKLSANHASTIYSLLNNPADPRMGISMPEARKNGPIMKKLEAPPAEKIPFNTGGQSGYRIAFKDCTIVLEEDEFDLVKNRIDTSMGWGSTEDALAADELLAYLKKIPSEPESEVDDKDKK